MKYRMVILTALILGLLVSVPSAFAGDAAKNGGFYVTAKGGGAWLNHSGSAEDNATGATTSSKWDDDSYVFGAAVGYNWVEFVPLRTEIEYLYRSDLDYKYDNTSNATSFKDDIDIQTLYANFYYDFVNQTDFTPYVGVGVGLAIIGEDMSDTGYALADESHTTTNFSWNAGAGVAYHINEMVALDLGYRYSSFGSGKDIDTTDLKFRAKNLSAHEALLGVRFQF